jgi:hypothetical protein
LAGTIKFHFSHSFALPVWHILADDDLLAIENRDGEHLKVSFSALEVSANKFLIKDWVTDDWLTGLVGVKKHVLLLQKYVTKGNPDKKSIMAFDMEAKHFRWEVNNFSFSHWDGVTVWGSLTQGESEPAVIDVASGAVTQTEWKMEREHEHERQYLPVQYVEGAEHFETIKKFIQKQIRQTTVMGVEYLEFGGFIIISAYFSENDGLANYLIVFNRDGDVVLNQKLGERLSGLGVGTFFIFSGCLFFVKNRLELLAYKFYD